ncbi:MAG: SCO family protein [Verrucomicrobiales bacterium]|nr:SCO family protein [Verrucomicrobiales bacterium]
MISANPGLPPARRVLPLAILAAALLALMFSVAFFLPELSTPRTPQSSLDPTSRTSVTLPRPLPEFSLVDSSGHPVSRSDLIGHEVVFNFVFTSCSLSCRAVSHRMAEIQHGVADLPDVRLLSFSIDPRTDSPSVLAAFAREFGADPARWRFLTRPQNYGTTSRTTGWITNPQDWMPLVPEGSLGTERILLVDRIGVVRESFDGLQPDVASQVIQRLRQPLACPPPSAASPSRATTRPQSARSPSP